MLEKFEPNDYLDKDIYERVVGLHKANIFQAAGFVDGK